MPKPQRKAVFMSVHSLAHPGIRATRRLITSRYVWRGCAADVATWCRECTGCARGKVTVQERTEPAVIPVPEKHFAHVHVDIVGPLPTSQQGYSHVLTIIDRATRWPEVLPLQNMTARECADVFITGWVARYGVPQTLTTDRGTQFTSELWKSMCKTLGVHHVTTTAYHPQSNGMIERFHRQMKEGLRARECGTAWIEHLPWVLLGLRAAPKEESGVSAAEAVFGRQLVLPGQAQDQVGSVEHQRADCGEFRPAIPAREVKKPCSRPSVLKGAEFVYVRENFSQGTFSKQYSGPYRVLEHTQKVYKLQVGDRVETVSADRLKPHTGPPPQPAEPPRRGRPPGSGGVLGSSSATASELEGGPVEDDVNE